VDLGSRPRRPLGNPRAEDEQQQQQERRLPYAVQYTGTAAAGPASVRIVASSRRALTASGRSSAPQGDDWGCEWFWICLMTSWTSSRFPGRWLKPFTAKIRGDPCRPSPDRQNRVLQRGGSTTTSIQLELWVENAREAVAFYAAAFGAAVLHLVGDGDDIVVQFGVGDAAFWIAPASATMKRLDPRAIDGATSRTLLVVDDPGTVAAQAARAGAREMSPVADQHGWRVGRIIDPFGHEWEIGKPLGPWPPN